MKHKIPSITNLDTTTALNAKINKATNKISVVSKGES